MAEVRIENVVKSFGKTEVIHGVSTTIGDGEFAVIVGPSGCGKSTLLRLVAGLEEITDGTIAIDGRVVNQLEPKDRDIAMVFQNYALYPHMTVFNNMAYGLKLRNFTGEQIKARVDQAAELLQLDGFLDRKPRQLSGGQRQRVAMGRCIVREPKVFLFDEPLSNLDAKLRVQMRIELRNLHERLKVTSIYVTHDQVEAMTLGDRLIVLRDGHAEQIGSPLEVYKSPKTVFVAGFIGSPAMNFFDARVGDDGKSVALKGSDGTLPIPNAVVAAQKKVIVGIRPEHFRLAENGSGNIPINVDHVETLGADTLVHGRLNNEPSLFTIRLSDMHQFDKGTELSLTSLPGKIHLFDKETERRIEK